MYKFEVLINQIISLDIPLVYEVLALVLLGSFLDIWETLVAGTWEYNTTRKIKSI